MTFLYSFSFYATIKRWRLVFLVIFCQSNTTLTVQKLLLYYCHYRTKFYTLLYKWHLEFRANKTAVSFIMSFILVVENRILVLVFGRNYFKMMAGVGEGGSGFVCFEDLVMGGTNVFVVSRIN